MKPFNENGILQLDEKNDNKLSENINNTESTEITKEHFQDLLPLMDLPKPCDGILNLDEIEKKNEILNENIQEKNYIPIENIKETNYIQKKIQTCRKNCGFTIEFVNQIDPNMDHLHKDISNCFKRFGIIVKILKFDGIYSVKFNRRGSVKTVLQQKKLSIS